MNIDDRWVCSRCLTIVSRGQSCTHCGFSDADYHPKPHHLPPEALLKQRYLVACVLGEGGFGITYAGWDLTLDQPIAIKEYFPAGFTGRDASLSFSALPAQGPAKSWYYAGRERFLREARILAMLSGVRGIVPVRDFFEENDTAYIVMDFIHGESLRALASRTCGAIAPAALFSLLRPVFDALILVHHSGILHRDISPDNILIDRTGTAWLIDFGAAEELSPQDETRSHAVILRKGYTPLEQYDSHGQQGPWSDLYALAATIYDMLCAQAPPEAILRVEKDGLVPPRVRGARISRAEQRALLRALSPQISGRQRSMEQFRSELYHLPLPEELARHKRIQRWTIVLSCVVLLVGALLLLHGTHGFPSASGCGISLARGYAAVRSYAGDDTADVPERIFGLPVRAVLQEAFRGNTRLKQITLPDSLLEIQEMAFFGCTALEEIVVPQGVTRIDAYAFADCSALKAVYLPDSVTEIAASAFSGCSDALVLFGSTGSYAEQYANDHDLLFCDPDCFEYTVLNGCAVITRYTGQAKCVVFPAKMDGFPVASITGGMSQNKSVERVIISEGIAAIGEQAFAYDQNLREVTIPSSVKRIGNLAFTDCGFLKTVHFSEGLEEIGESAFSYARSLTGITLPASLRTIGAFAFESCTGLKSVRIPAGVTSLPMGVFSYCDQLSNVTFAEGLTSIGENAFDGCVSLIHLRLPRSLTEIGYHAFAGCSALETLYIPQETARINPNAFVNEYGFEPNTSANLVLIGFPGSAAESVAEQAGLTFDDVSLWCDASELYYEPCEGGMMITYYSGTANDLVLPTYLNEQPVVAVGVDSFYDCSSLTSVVLPRRLETILNSAFSYCPNLVRVEFPSSLKRIDYYAFYRCNLEEISLPSSLTTLGYNAFDSNLNLRHASFGSGLSYVDETALTDCLALETLEIASAGCVSGYRDLPNLRAVMLGDGVHSVLGGSFVNCPALRDVYLSSAVISIAPDAFSGVNQLTIHASAGSYGESFAREHGYRFAVYP